MKIEAHFTEGSMQIELLAEDLAEKKFIALFERFDKVSVWTTHSKDMSYYERDYDKLVIRLKEEAKPGPTETSHGT